MFSLQAPAKINLYLRVVGPRPDGYHDIETLFARIDLADTLSFEKADTFRFSCSDATLSCGEDNLIVKAARLLQQESGKSKGAAIHLEKRIPIAAGLGGGSSDAAAALLGLAHLWKLNLNRDQLIALGARLGSDVPFFLKDTAYAIGMGRGELCQPIKAQKALDAVIVVPNAQLSTASIYQAGGFDLTADKPSINLIKHALCNGSLGELATGLWNDLEPEAIRRCPVILTIHQQLRDLGCLGVRLSGSGPASFGICKDILHTRTVASEVERFGLGAWRVFVTRALMDMPQLPKVLRII